MYSENMQGRPVNMEGIDFRMQLHGAKESLELLNALQKKLDEVNRMIRELSAQPVEISIDEYRPGADCRQAGF